MKFSTCSCKWLTNLQVSETALRSGPPAKGHSRQVAVRAALLQSAFATMTVQAGKRGATAGSDEFPKLADSQHGRGRGRISAASGRSGPSERKLSGAADLGGRGRSRGRGAGPAWGPGCSGQGLRNELHPGSGDKASSVGGPGRLSNTGHQNSLLDSSARSQAPSSSGQAATASRYAALAASADTWRQSDPPQPRPADSTVTSDQQGSLRATELHPEAQAARAVGHVGYSADSGYSRLLANSAVPRPTASQPAARPATRPGAPANEKLKVVSTEQPARRAGTQAGRPPAGGPAPARPPKPLVRSTAAAYQAAQHAMAPRDQSLPPSHQPLGNEGAANRGRSSGGTLCGLDRASRSLRSTSTAPSLPACDGAGAHPHPAESRHTGQQQTGDGEGATSGGRGAGVAAQPTTGEAAAQADFLRQLLGVKGGPAHEPKQQHLCSGWPPLPPQLQRQQSRPRQ